MGLSNTPQDSAPAYDDVFNDHPVNQFPPTGSSSSVSSRFTNQTSENISLSLFQYRSVPQDDIELHAGEHACAHNLSNTVPGPGHPAESLTQPGGYKHTHCEQCDVQTAAREQRENERHCCTMTAWVFMVGFAAFMVVGIVAVSAMAKSRRGHHD